MGAAPVTAATSTKRTMVVLPTYNERENLPIMVETLHGLAIPGLELLVVDDNSPDGTGALAAAVRRKRVLDRTIMLPDVIVPARGATPLGRPLWRDTFGTKR